MDLGNLKKAIMIARDLGITLNAVGAHGIGKSDIVRQVCAENNLEFIDFRLGQMSDAAELLGLPEFMEMFSEAMDKDTKYTTYAHPSIMPHEGKGILHLDELNRANKDVIQAVFQLVLDRQLGEYKLPDEWSIMVSSNPSTDDYSVGNFDDQAFKDRFCHIKVEPSVHEWIDYMYTQDDVLKDGVEFFNQNKRLLEDASLENFNIDKKPSRRSVHKALRVANVEGIDNNLKVELMSGLIGPEAATGLNSYLKNLEKSVTAEEILAGFDKVSHKIDPKRVDLLSKINADLIEKIYQNCIYSDVSVTDEQLDNLGKYMAHIPRDNAAGIRTKLNQDAVMEIIKNAGKDNLPKMQELTKNLVNSGFVTRFRENAFYSGLRTEMTNMKNTKDTDETSEE